MLDLIPVLKKKDKVQMASASRQRVVEVFEAGKQYQKYFELYNNLIMR